MLTEVLSVLLLLSVYCFIPSTRSSMQRLSSVLHDVGESVIVHVDCIDGGGRLSTE
jgi:hypothetical protein